MSGYWRVNTTQTYSGHSVKPHTRVQSLRVGELDPQTVALLEMEAEEETRLADEVQGSTSLGDELEHDEDTDWLRGCKWPQWFAHKPLHLIVSTSITPSHCDEDLHLGSWNCTEWISCSTSEARLRKLVELTGLVLDRCEETLVHTPRVMCCWLRSWGQHFYAYPFELPQRQTTRSRYRLYLNRFLCYIFRSWQVCRRFGQDMYEIYGLRLSTAQVQTMDHIWTSLAVLLRTEVESSPIASSPPIGLLETLFQLLAMFWTDVSTDGATESKAIIHFSGVLGIHPYELVYRTAYDYTPYLSALLWMGRLIILEYALPLRAYETLTIPWPARATYPDQGKRLCAEIRPKYLQRGSFSPMGYLIERLQHGRAIAKREGARTNISWSLDGKKLEIAGSHITIQEFRQTVHLLLAKLEQEAHKLMFDWWPKVDLSEIKDDIAKHQPGYSFLQEPSNQLQTSFKHLSRRAFSADKGGFALQGDGRKRAVAYLKRRDRFIRLLFAGIHLTSGMPARGEELRVIRWADTAAVPRNIFVHKGRVMLVFSYNKAGIKSNNSFFIVRVPCPIVERVLFLHLAYIRPFSDFLTRQLKLISATAATNLHLFTIHSNPTACFSSAACSRCLRESTPECPIPLHFQIYRQIVVSISKKHIPALQQPFDPNTPNDYNGFLSLLSFQTGHKPSTRAGAYGLDRAYPAKLQPDLIERYFQNSLVWHQFVAITDEDLHIIDVDSDMDRPFCGSVSQVPGYCPDPSNTRSTKAVSEVDLSDSDQDLSWESVDESVATLASFQPRKRKYTKDISLSPTLKKIELMRQELVKLEREYKRRR